MSQDPFISIITITLNAAKFLEEQLSSVSRQEGVAYEQILFDGGSQDATLEIASRFPHLTLIEGRDEGISDAMNQGAKEARGKYLLFLHADDGLAHPFALQEVTSTLQNHDYPLWAFGRLLFVDGDGKITNLSKSQEVSRKKLLKYNVIPHPALFIQSAFFRELGGYDKERRYAMDYAFWLRAIHRTPPLPMPHLIARYREHAHALSQKEALALNDEVHDIRQAYLTKRIDRWRSWRTWKRRKKKTLLTRKRSRSGHRE